MKSEPRDLPDETDPPTHLSRLLLLRAGRTVIDRNAFCIGETDPPLSPAGRRQMRELTRHWEWADRVIASTLRRAWESARILAPEHRIRLDPRWRARGYGPWEGRDREELRKRDPIAFKDWEAEPDGSIPGGESPDAFRSRVREALASLEAGQDHSVLVATHFDVIRVVARELLGEALPAGRPRLGEMVLLTATSNGAWTLGRRSSDPPALRSPFERAGLSYEGRAPERHVAELEID